MTVAGTVDKCGLGEMQGTEAKRFVLRKTPRSSQAGWHLGTPGTHWAWDRTPHPTLVPHGHPDRPWDPEAPGWERTDDGF